MTTHHQDKTKFALLIGAQNDLKGVKNDLTVMEAALRAREFECQRCSGKHAMRVAILDTLGALADTAGRYDEVVIYYSGHGARVPNRGLEAALAGHYQNLKFIPMLLPTDATAGNAANFRGILVAELEVYFQRIVAAGARLTVIFDCCHASAVVRSGASPQEGEPARSGASAAGSGSSWAPDLEHEYTGIRGRTLTLETPYLAGLAAHIRKLSTAGDAMSDLAAECNPAIVRLVASDEGQAAREEPAEAVSLDVRDPVKVGEYYGVMTAALVRALAEVGSAPVPWHVVGRRVRALAAAHSGQRVILKGPHRRILFSRGEDGLRRVAGIAAKEQALALDVGAMCGVEVGDRFFVWPPRESSARGRVPAPVTAIAEVVVTQVDGSRAWVEPVGTSDLSVTDARLAHATVSPSGCGRARARVRLRPITEAGERLLPEVLSQVAGLTRAGEDDADADVMADVVEEDGYLEVRRPGGGLLRQRADFQPGITPGIADVALCFVREALEDLAVAHALIHLVSADGAALLRRVTWSIECPATRGRDPFDARTLDEPLQIKIGDHVTVDVKIGDGGADSLFIWLLLVGPGGEVSLLSRRSPRGAEITATTPYVLGLQPDGRRSGEKIVWPMSVPAEHGDRTGWIVLVVADGPADLTMWETGPVVAWQTRRDLLEGAGGRRAVSGPMPEDRAVRWGVERVQLEIGDRGADS